MPTPIETVEALLARMGDPGGFGHAVREFFTAGTVYENVGLWGTVGMDETLERVAQFEQGLGASAIRVDTLAIAAVGNTVLTERIDHIVDKAGKTTLSIRLMGIFVVAGGKVTEWRDYFDTAALRPA